MDWSAIICMGCIHYWAGICCYMPCWKKGCCMFCMGWPTNCCCGDWAGIYCCMGTWGY